MQGAGQLTLYGESASSCSRSRRSSVQSPYILVVSPTPWQRAADSAGYHGMPHVSSFRVFAHDLDWYKTAMPLCLFGPELVLAPRHTEVGELEHQIYQPRVKFVEESLAVDRARRA